MASGKAGAATFPKRVGNGRRNRENCHGLGTLGGHCGGTGQAGADKSMGCREAEGPAQPLREPAVEARHMVADRWGAPTWPLHLFYRVLKVKTRSAEKEVLNKV